MVGSGRTVGSISIAVGVVCLLVTALFIASGIAGGDLTTSGAILGVGLFGVVPLLLFSGVGAYLFVRGRAEAAAMIDVRRKERLLGLIQAQGKVPLSTIMVELKITRDTVKQDIYELVQQGLFAGYINWDQLTFYSSDAQRVGSTTCASCGGVRELAGKGVVKCPYCGVELFLPPDALQTQAIPAPPLGS